MHRRARMGLGYLPQEPSVFRKLSVRENILAFLEETGRNRTPDKLPADESKALTEICDRHLKQLVEIIQPEWVVGVGTFAENRAREVLDHPHGERVSVT